MVILAGRSGLRLKSRAAHVGPILNLFFLPDSNPELLCQTCQDNGKPWLILHCERLIIREGLDHYTGGISTGGRRISNLRYANYTTFIALDEEEIAELVEFSSFYSSERMRKGQHFCTCRLHHRSGWRLIGRSTAPNCTEQISYDQTA